jgi:hypothetical protein
VICCVNWFVAVQVYTWPSANQQHGSLLSSPTSLSSAGNTMRDDGLLMGIMGVGDLIPE